MPLAVEGLALIRLSQRRAGLGAGCERDREGLRLRRRSFPDRLCLIGWQQERAQRHEAAHVASRQ